MNRNNFYSQFNSVWAILNEWRTDHPEGESKENEQKWEEACVAMEWLLEDMEAAERAFAYGR